MASQSVEPRLERADWPMEYHVQRQGVVVLDSNSPDYAWLTLLELSGSCHPGQISYVYTFKRCFDIVVASVLLVVLLLPLSLVTLLVYLEIGGPVIFRQARMGRSGKPFTIYKFRTMIHDRRRDTATFGGEERRCRHKTAHDPRVTRFGRLLRRTSIDELPQLVNVLRGDMSLIGPRPELVEIVNRYADWQHQRHLVRPGLTGWWQVHGRGDLPMHEHTELDLYYVRNLSFRLDLHILVKTISIVLHRAGAF